MLLVLCVECIITISTRIIFCCYVFVVFVASRVALLGIWNDRTVTPLSIGYEHVWSGQYYCKIYSTPYFTRAQNDPTYFPL